MARLVRFHQLGGPEVLRIEDIFVALPQPGEVRIRVHALGLNRAEAQFRSGLYIEAPDLPAGLGLEAAGVIETIGPNVTGMVPGDRVAVIPPVSMKVSPVHGEVVNFPAHLVVPIPNGQSFEGAAATWMAYLTAFGGLLEVAAIEAGDQVVISAASSSVGLAAIQVAKAVGAIPIALTRTNRKRDALLAAGAARVIATDPGDVAESIRAVTGPRGARVFFDGVGGRLVPMLVSAAAPGGIVINYGALDADITELPPAALLKKSLTLRGYLMHEVTQSPASLSRAKAFILERLASGEFCPVIARTFALDEIVAAYQYLESNEQFGKVVVTV